MLEEDTRCVGGGWAEASAESLPARLSGSMAAASDGKDEAMGWRREVEAATATSGEEAKAGADE